MCVVQVEQIVDMECRRRWKCPVKFRVRWVGYSEKDDTWLPASELNCEDLIQEFLEISGRSFEFKGAMAPRKRPAEGGEMTMQTRKAMRFSYSELDEDQDEVMPAGTRTRKVKVRAEPRPPKPLTAKKRPAATHSRSIGRASHREPEEYEVESVVDHRVRGRFTEYKVRWKGFGPREDSWVPEAELSCDNLLNKYFKRAGRNEEESYEVQEIMDIRKVKGRTEYKVRWKRWSAKYDSWLPEEELNCPELMKRFNATIKNEEEEEEEEEEYEVDSCHLMARLSGPTQDEN
ncbi:Chromobox 5 [Chionoecetes opilio]|uniref:Chromobox 5 n=1 Tax=Chionoecetes opilio TaxID=41210 RepID=A0A8J4Y9X1_CHIOP|nr:Chromobox 5 [Chionoecetes opilio]